jgi:hypothetical protein
LGGGWEYQCLFLGKSEALTFKQRRDKLINLRLFLSPVVFALGAFFLFPSQLA